MLKYTKHTRKPRLALILGIFLSTLMLVAVGVNAQEANLVSLFNPVRVVVNSSFISPLDEVFGDVLVGKGVFVAGNTILRAEPDTRICLGNQTNLQDNILFLARRRLASPASSCAAKASSTGERVSIAHQAQIENSKIGNFTFMGFRSRLNNVVLEDGAFVLHGATVSNIRIGKNRLVPTGAVITTQAQADALPLKTEANSEFQNEVLEVNKEFAENYSQLI